MDWKPIDQLTDEHYDLALYSGRLVVANSCNGPHHIRPLLEGYYSADDIRRDPWETFCILPPPPGNGE